MNNNSCITNTLSIPNSIPTVSKFEFDAEPVLDGDKLRCLTG